MRVISEFFEQFRDRPILVIGGGPSVTDDLMRLHCRSDFKPALVISANDHGCKQQLYPVDWIVHCDKTHCEQTVVQRRRVSMEEWLRPYGKPLVSKWSTANIRLTDWRFNGNTGTTAVAVAAALGGSPIVVTGLDFWATGRRYFWDGQEAPRERRKLKLPIDMGPDRRLNALGLFVEHAHIRPMSGLLVTRWPKWDPAEQFQPAQRIPYCDRRFDVAEYRALTSFHWSNYDTVPAGAVIKLTISEAADLLRKGKIAAT